MPTVGMFHQLEEAHGAVVGRMVAVDALVLALAELSADHRYHLYAPARDRASVAARLGLQNGGGRVEVRERASLAAADAWHDCQFDTRLPFLARDRLRGRFPVTITHHTLSYKELLHDKILRLLLAGPRASDALVCTSRAALEAMKALVEQVADRAGKRVGAELGYPGRYQHIPLGVDCERFRPNDRELARSRFDLPQGAFVMLWVGRLSIFDKADLLPLVPALGELRRRHPNVLLVCAGSERRGEAFGAVLDAFARDSGLRDAVRVIPRHEDFGPWLPQLYGAADVFLSPIDNIQETFGLTPAEAMACGVPQIVSDWDGYRDTVVHGETGFLLPTRWTGCARDVSDDAWFADSALDHLILAQSVAVDMAALVDGVSALVERPELRAAMAEASRERALAEFSWQAVVRRYESLWLELAAEAARAPEPPEPTPAHDLPDYQAVFGRFASRWLDDGAELRLGERGIDLLRGASLPLHYNETWAYLDVDTLKRVLFGFAKMHDKGAGLTLGKVAAVIAKGGGERERARALRHAMWLLKYDYLRLV